MMAFMSETSKYRSLVAPYCFIRNPDPIRFPLPWFSDMVPGVGIDLASGGDPIVPWSFQLELPHDRYAYYNSNQPVRGPIQLRGDAFFHRAVEGDSLDWVFSSHLLEDASLEDWPRIFKLWSSYLKPGGYLLLLIPDRELWAKALANGQPPNNAHCHEGTLGEMSAVARQVGLEVVEERLTALFPGDYSIFGCFRRP